MTCLNETIDQLSMAYSVHWHGHVMSMALECEAEGERSCVEYGLRI